MSDDGIDRDNLMEVVLVFNGSLEMSPGKMSGQAFQAAIRCLDITDESVNLWFEDGTRTIVKVAKTPAIFDRVCQEVNGEVMVDEGFTEVEENALTLFVSHPFLHKDRPVLLDNKKVKLL